MIRKMDPPRRLAEAGQNLARVRLDFKANFPLSTHFSRGLVLKEAQAVRRGICD